MVEVESFALAYSRKRLGFEGLSRGRHLDEAQSQILIPQQPVTNPDIPDYRSLREAWRQSHFSYMGIAPGFYAI